MHTIDTIADLIRVLKEEPEWAEALRNLLLSQEFLELPARFQAFVRVTEENNRLMRERLDRVESDIRDLKAGQAETNQRLNHLTGQVEDLTGQVGSLTGQVGSLTGQVEDLTGQVGSLTRQVGSLTGQVEDLTGQVGSLTGQVEDLTGQVGSLTRQVGSLTGQVEDLTGQVGSLTGQVENLTGQVEGLTGQVEGLTGQVGNLAGADLERQVHANIIHFAGRLKLRKVRILKSQIVGDNEELQDCLADAEEQGIISLEQEAQIQQADIVFRGRHRRSAQSVHVVAEVSRSIADYDIVRAADRAQILALATGCETLAIVIGVRIEPKQQTLAQCRNVAVLLYKERRV